MFDSMSLHETISDMFDTGVTDDTLNILYDANTNVSLSVKTPYGLTEEIHLDYIVPQGDLISPLESSVMVDTIGKSLLEEEERGESNILYKYRGEVTIPPLALMDDISAVTLSGYKASLLNSHINVHSADKILTFSAKKCKYMNTRNLGRYAPKFLAPAEGWWPSATD